MENVFILSKFEDFYGYEIIFGTLLIYINILSCLSVNNLARIQDILKLTFECLLIYLLEIVTYPPMTHVDRTQQLVLTVFFTAITIILYFPC